jgi:undecaprenyl diphosphate synthase
MNLFVTGLTKESKALHKNNVQLRVIGDTSRFDAKLQDAIAKAEQLTAQNDGIILQIAANYGGRWDMVQAVNRFLAEHPETRTVSEQDISNYLMGADLPEPDLLIRTGGEVRISNFLLWQSAYTELYFSPKLWPDFDSQALQEAVSEFGRRQRRFGKTAEQITSDAARSTER